MNLKAHQCGIFVCLFVLTMGHLFTQGERGRRETDTPVLTKQRKSASTRNQTHKPALRRILLNISISCCPAGVPRVQSLFASPSHHNSLVSGFQGAQVALSPVSAADTETCSVLWETTKLSDLASKKLTKIPPKHWNIAGAVSVKPLSVVIRMAWEINQVAA